jgi:hypothetical protein
VTLSESTSNGARPAVLAALRLLPGAPCCGPPEAVLGTVPFTVTALSVRLPARASTPFSCAILATWEAGKLSCAADMKSVRVNFSPGLAWLARSKRRGPFSFCELLALGRREPGGIRGPFCPNFSGRVTDMSVPDAGERLEDLVLGLVEALAERADGDDEADRRRRARARVRRVRPFSAPKFRHHVAQVEHGREHPLPV